MNLKFFVTALAFIAFNPSISYSSCAGVKGCNPCYDSLRGTTKEDVACSKDSECVAIPHHCEGFYALNKAHSAQFIRKNLPPTNSKKLPKTECKFDAAWNAKVCRIKSLH
jgi:hypothetical protein